MTAHKLEKRIGKLEETVRPKPHRRWSVIYMKGDETEDEAMARKGISPEERGNYNYFFVTFVDPPARDSILENT